MLIYTNISYEQNPNPQATKKIGILYLSTSNRQEKENSPFYLIFCSLMKIFLGDTRLI